MSETTTSTETATANAIEADAPPRPRRRRWLRRAALVLLLVVVAGAAWAWRLAGAPPEWYAPLDPADERVAELAERTEYGLVEAFHKIRADDEPWTVRLGETHVNSWLASRLPAWAEHDETTEWPEELRGPQVRLDEGGIDLAVEIDYEGTARVLVARLTPRLTEEGLQLVVDSVGVGRLGVPGPVAGKVVELLDRLAPGGVVDARTAQEFVGVLTGGAPLDAHIELSDGRRVQLMDMLLTDGAIEFTNRTLPGGDG